MISLNYAKRDTSGTQKSGYFDPIFWDSYGTQFSKMGQRLFMTPIARSLIRFGHYKHVQAKETKAKGQNKLDLRFLMKPWGWS